MRQRLDRNIQYRIAQVVSRKCRNEYKFIAIRISNVIAHVTTQEWNYPAGIFLLFFFFFYFVVGFMYSDCNNRGIIGSRLFFEELKVIYFRISYFEIDRRKSTRLSIAFSQNLKINYRRFTNYILNTTKRVNQYQSDKEFLKCCKWSIGGTSRKFDFWNDRNKRRVYLFTNYIRILNIAIDYTITVL